MKIGMLIPAFPAQTHAFFWREAQALQELGHEVFFLSTRRPKEPCPHAFGAEARERTHYVFPPNPRAVRSLPPKLRRAPAVLRYLTSLSEGGRRRLAHISALVCAFDLVAFVEQNGIEHIHVHSCADAAHLVALSYLLGGPSFSLHLHGDLPVYGTDHVQKMQNALFVAAAARPMIRQLVEDAKVPEERTVVMPMGVDTRSFAEPAYPPRSGPLQLLSVSRLASCKGHRYALGAIRHWIDAGAELRYTIVGSGPDRASIEADIRRYGLGAFVQLLGALSEREVRRALQQAHVFLLTSFGVGEASPVAVMESMASGVPAICSRIGGTPDMIEDGVDGLLVPQCEEAAIAAAIRKLDEDDELRREMGKAARRRAIQKFDSRALAERFIHQVVSRKRDGAGGHA